MIAECSNAIRGAAVAAGAVTALECITTLGKVLLDCSVNPRNRCAAVQRLIVNAGSG